MAVVKINKKKYNVPPISELDFNTFNKVFSVRDGVSLNEYISLFVNIPSEDIVNAKIETWFSELIHHTLFDVDIEKEINREISLFKFESNSYHVEDMRLETFGDMYFFDLYYSMHLSGDINMYELSIKCLASYLSDTLEMSDVDRAYKVLCKMPWLNVLPVGFFLLKNALKTKKHGWITRIKCILALKVLKRRNLFHQTKLRNILRSWLDRFCAI